MQSSVSVAHAEHMLGASLTQRAMTFTGMMPLLMSKHELTCCFFLSF